MTATTPTSVDALADVVRAAAAASSPLEVGGGFTRRGIGRAMQTAEQLSTAALSGITLYEPGALTLVAQAGTPVAEIEAALDAENQRLAFEPMDHRALLGTDGTPTIGGVVGGNISGPRRVQAGACRDALIGVKFVDGRGDCISNGGRVMKNVTGYDLAKLICGSWGTLGVLTEVGFKVLPKPERSATLAIHATNRAEAVSLMSQALGSPFDVTGAAFDGDRVLIRVEGLDGQVRYRLAQLQTLLKPKSESEQIEGDAHAAIWTAMRDVKAFAASDAPVWKISVKPSEAPVVTAAIESMADARFQLDWGGGLIWVAIDNLTDADAGEAIVRGAIADAGGHATLIRAPEPVRASVPVFQPEHPRIAKLSQALRQQFDPAGILNPGKCAA